MRERAGLIGATLEFGGVPGGGSEVRLEMPS
jgi:signal transduction histidine kinase